MQRLLAEGSLAEKANQKIRDETKRNLDDAVRQRNSNRDKWRSEIVPALETEVRRQNQSLSEVGMPPIDITISHQLGDSIQFAMQSPTPGRGLVARASIPDSRIKVTYHRPGGMNNQASIAEPTEYDVASFDPVAMIADVVECYIGLQRV
jgi:hypothetical protein